jgi:hypothetical protein
MSMRMGTDGTTFPLRVQGWALAEATRDAQYKSMRPVIATGIFYALTTPVGVAIGV